MARRRFPLALPFLFCVVAFAPAALAQPAAEQAAIKPDPASRQQGEGKSFLWKVRSKTATVYLLGSVHVAKKDLYPLSPAIESAFDESDKLVLEINLDAASQGAAALKLLRTGSYGPGDSLEKHIDKELKEKLDTCLKKSGLPAGALSRFKPWLVAVQLTMLELQKEGFDAKNGIDHYFQGKAQGKKPILSLETADDQVQMFADFPEDLQEAMLRQTLDELPETGRTIEATFAAWKKGDTDALDELLLAPMRTREYKPLFQKIFIDRNEKMAEKIEGLLKTDGTCFVVVGAGHLIGEKGIVDLLQKKNYTVEQQRQ